MVFKFQHSYSPDVASSGSTSSSDTGSSQGFGQSVSHSSNADAGIHIPSSEELFSDIEKMYIDDSKDEDDIIGRPVEENVEDLDENQTNDGEGSENANDGKGKEQETLVDDEDDGLPLFRLTEKIDDEDVDLVIESVDDLKYQLRRAVVAPKLYQQNKELRTENETLKVRAANADEFDRMAKEEPLDLIDIIAEDIPEEALVEWIRAKAKYLGQPQPVREAMRKQREAEYIRKTWEAQQEAKNQLSQRAAEVEQEAQHRLVTSWRESEYTKWASKVPQEHHELLKDLIDQQLLYASNMARGGQNVELNALSQRLFKFASAIAGSKKQIEKKIGEQTQAARQQAKSKLQQVANTRRSGAKQSPGQMPSFNGDTDALFDYLSRAAGDGSIKFK